jgi:hypothetical protein
LNPRHRAKAAISALIMTFPKAILSTRDINRVAGGFIFTTTTEANMFDIPLSQGPREIRSATGKSVTYAKLYRAVLDGDVPAQTKNNRWFLDREALPSIANLLGTTASRPAAGHDREAA